VRAARGFCPAHAWHVQDAINASALGIAVLYEGVIRHLLADMGMVEPGDGRRQVSQAESALRPRGPCPACEHQARVEEHLLRNLMTHIGAAEFAEGFAASAGLCLPHLRQMLEQKGSAEHKAQVLTIQQAIWSALQAQLAEFMRKHDYRFTAEGMGEEGSSPRRSIEALSGQKGLR
ncbi:MAG: hypothetical protein IT325_04965, partial [Anaerolineae bacterium]|nr:hypothetical protein [Anaerolineae bacterium]